VCDRSFDVFAEFHHSARIDVSRLVRTVVEKLRLKKTTTIKINIIKNNEEENRG
jgi:hypothetical protein